LTHADRRRPDPAPLAPDERIYSTFPLTRWAGDARSRAGLDAAWERAVSLSRTTGTPIPEPPEGGEWAGGGWGGVVLPKRTDWDAYTVELIERPLRSDEIPAETFPSAITRVEGGSITFGVRPDGSIGTTKDSAAVVWRHIRTVVRHPDATAALVWERDDVTIERISIVGLAHDPDPLTSCRILAAAIPLVREFEWQGERRRGRPTLTDEDVRRDLAAALAQCRKQGWKEPTLRQLADWHARPYDPASDQVGVTENALRERMWKHPGPFRELVPWIKRRAKE
jgi:hypothetical protein